MEGVCISCGKTKAKRWCSALNSHVCSLCCGRKRKIEIDCPQNCFYLVKGELYELQKKKEEEILEREIPIYITGEEFLKRYVDPKKPRKLDFFVFEISNIAGAIVEDFSLKTSNLSISPKSFVDQLVKRIIPFCYDEVNKCYDCQKRCPTIYHKDGTSAFKKYILKKGTSINDFPEELHDQTLGDFFAVTLGNRLLVSFKKELNKLNQENKIGLLEEDIYDCAEDFYQSIIVFVSDCFYCNNLCPAKPKEDGICYFCEYTDRYKGLCVFGSESNKTHLLDGNRQFKSKKLPLFGFGFMKKTPHFLV